MVPRSAAQATALSATARPHMLYTPMNLCPPSHGPRTAGVHPLRTPRHLRPPRSVRRFSVLSPITWICDCGRTTDNRAP